jgi:hypothetical protein
VRKSQLINNIFIYRVHQGQTVQDASVDRKMLFRKSVDQLKQIMRVEYELANKNEGAA